MKTQAVWNDSPQVERWMAWVIACLVLLSGLVSPDDADAQDSKTVYRSPVALAVSPDGKRVYVSDRTGNRLTVVDAVSHKRLSDIAVGEQPRGLCVSPDGKTIYLAERMSGTVAVIDAAGQKVRERIPVGHRPVAVSLAAGKSKLYVAIEDTNRVAVIDLKASPVQVAEQIETIREPCSLAVTSDERHVVVANLLPDGANTDPTLSAMITIIGTDKMKAEHVKLPPGSTCVQAVCVSPDGKQAYAVHSLGRFTLPITQLERGWVNTTALSIIDVAGHRLIATMLLDSLTQGAPDPYGIVASPDGRRVYITHAGPHEVSVVETGLIAELLAGKVPEKLASLKDGNLPNIWVRIQKDPSQITDLQNDLTALYIADAIKRLSSGGKGPRGLAVTPDGKQLFVGNFYSGNVAIVDTEAWRSLGTINLGPQPEADAIRRGELVFHDATKAFQRWYSCSTCHPNTGRVDGLSWDFLRDGIGNPKDTINLVYVGETEPLNRRGTRATAAECARTGLETGHMIVPTQKDVDDLLAFLLSLRPEPSPLLEPDGKLSASAIRGKQIFEGKADCLRCHPGPYYTDKKMHDVGTFSAPDPDGRYDTPSLIEAYRTAPYLHDGRARTIEEIFTRFDPKDLHGKARQLTPKELEDLTTYILSL